VRIGDGVPRRTLCLEYGQCTRCRLQALSLAWTAGAEDAAECAPDDQNDRGVY